MVLDAVADLHGDTGLTGQRLPGPQLEIRPPNQTPSISEHPLFVGSENMLRLLEFDVRFSLTSFTKKTGEDMQKLGVLGVAIFVTCCDLSIANADPFSDAIKSAQIVKLDVHGDVAPSPRAIIAPSDLEIPGDLPFPEKIKRVSVILDKLGQVQLQANVNLAAAKEKKDFDNYTAAEADIDNLKKALAPYAVAQTQAETLIAQGYTINDFSGNVCMQAQCKPIDAMVAVFFFTGKHQALGPNFAPRNDQEPPPQNACPGGQNGDICINGFNVSLLIRFLGDKPIDALTGGLLPAVRDAIISPTDNGDLARIIRDPIKTPVKAIQDARDNIMEKTGVGGDAAKIIRDPIKCTVGKLWHGC